MAQQFARDLDKAIKARILEEINRKQERAAIVNNLYGGGPTGGSLQERMHQAEPVDDPFDYFVDIERTPGDVEGSWKKKVRRYREPK